jgi:hypothetical protein
MGAPHIADIGKYIKAASCNGISITAGGTGDDTALTGATIDRLGYGSVEFVIAYKTSLAASETLSFAAEYQLSSDGSSWDTAVSLQAATVARTGAVTNGQGVVKFDVNLEGLKRYIRFNFTPNLSRANTDTAVVYGTAILGGADLLPAV